MAYLDKEVIRKIILNSTKVRYTKVLDDNIILRARGLGYAVNNIENDITVIELPTETIICSVSNFELPVDISEMFDGCRYLEELDINIFDTTRVISMENMFYDCFSLEKLDLSNFNTSLVEDMGGLFCGCKSLKSLDISNFNTEQVCYMKFMFMNCISLKELDLSNFNTSNVKDMSYMFDNCISLEEIDISSFKLLERDDVTAFMFNNCKNLRKIYVNNDIKDKILFEIERTPIRDRSTLIDYEYQIDNIRDIGENKAVIEISLQRLY